MLLEEQSKEIGMPDKPLSDNALTMLQWGLGVTFIWMSVLIYHDPLGSTHMMFPWAIAMVPISLETMMREVAIFDLLIGLMLLSRRALWMGATLSSLHLFSIFLVTGINAVTARNIGLMAGCIAVALSVPIPHWVKLMIYVFTNQGRKLEQAI